MDSRFGCLVFVERPECLIDAWLMWIKDGRDFSPTQAKRDVDVLTAHHARANKAQAGLAGFLVSWILQGLDPCIDKPMEAGVAHY